MKNFFSQIVAFLSTFIVAGAALAEDGGAAGSDMGLFALGAGLAIGIAAAGGALGQGRAASAALEGIARNPSAADKVFVPFLLGLALMESLVILAFVIAFFLYGKL